MVIFSYSSYTKNVCIRLSSHTSTQPIKLKFSLARFVLMCQKCTGIKMLFFFSHTENKTILVNYTYSHHSNYINWALYKCLNDTRGIFRILLDLLSPKFINTNSDMGFTWSIVQNISFGNVIVNFITEP